MNDSRTRSWCFTVNNYDCSDLWRLPDECIRYLVIGFEGINGHTQHLQGYTYLYDARGLDFVRRWFGGRGHWEVARGTPQQNREYCIKFIDRDGNQVKEFEDDWIEWGDIPAQGKATFQKVEEAILNPEANFHTYHQYRKAYYEYLFTKKHSGEKKVYAVLNTFLYHFMEKQGIEKSEVQYNDIETYTNQRVLVLEKYHHFPVERWYNGIPPKIRLGYQVIDVNPEIVILVFDEDNIPTNKYLEDMYGKTPILI